jgi:prevent-host-death family protein
MVKLSSCHPMTVEVLGVAEAKARFSELIDRVRMGERFVVSRRGRPAVALVPPDDVPIPAPTPKGLAAGTGALADWDELSEVVDDVYAARANAKDRAGPTFE